MEIRTIKASQIKPAAYNPRRELQPGDPEYERLRRSMDEFGYVDPIIWNETTGNVVGGHQRLNMLLADGVEDIDVSVVHLTLEKEKALNNALNKISGEWDDEKLAALLNELSEADDIDETLSGFDDEEIAELLEAHGYDTGEGDGPERFRDKLNETPRTSLFETFLVPPFSLLDTRQAYWKQRKKAWLDFGIRSEVGRGDNLVFSKNIQLSDNDNGTSVFDPVLCEIMYRWFCPEGGTIFDPFSGGSVRGIIAKLTGHIYTGIDLRQEQVEANRANAEELDVEQLGLTWICDDSLNMDKHIADGSADMIFTCPPYFDLEQYSDDPRDISNMDYEGFTAVFEKILAKAAGKLKDNRFYVIVISDVRDKAGAYRDITGTIKNTLAKCGLCLYNDIILLNTVGSAAFRARRAMKNRKTVRVHQNVLVFYKGDTREIQKEFAELEEMDEDEIAAMIGYDPDEDGEEAGGPEDTPEDDE